MTSPKTGLGSTSLVTDDSGNEVSRAQYSPYGAIIEQSGTLPTDRLFTGQRHEQSINLYDYRARFYDPLTTNFLSPDSIVPNPGNPLAWNRYGYVMGNPVRYTDPSGHCAQVGDEACWSQYEQLKRICPNCTHYRTAEGANIPLGQLNYGQLDNLVQGFTGQYRLSTPPTWTENAATYATYGAVGLDALAVGYSAVQVAVLDTVGLIVIGSGYAGGGPAGAASAAGLVLEADIILALGPAGVPEDLLGIGSAGLTVLSDSLAGNHRFIYNDQGRRIGVVIGGDSIAAIRNAGAGLIAPEVHLDFFINSSQFIYDLERLYGHRKATSVEIRFSDVSYKDFISTGKSLLKSNYYECTWIGLCD